MADHDNVYKLLFSHARMVADLVRGFVDEEWVADLDFSSLEKVGGSYVADDLRHRENDVVWRLRRGKDDWVYVYILLEFQSTVDPYMAVRVMTYVGLLYQDLIRSKLLKLGDKLPPVLPIVLYNGHPLWGAARDVAALVEEMPAEFERHRPRLEYLLVDEERIAEGELESLRNVAAALFRLERSEGPKEVDRVLETLVDWLRSSDDTELRRAFLTWLMRVLLPRKMPGVEIPKLADLQEVRSMLAERVDDWTLGWKREGFEEGRREGLQEGLQQGLQQAREVLARQLEERFGPLSDDSRLRLEAIDSIEALVEISMRVPLARSLAELGLG